MAAFWRIEETGGRTEAVDADVWFQQPASSNPLLEVISVFGEEGEPTPGMVLGKIISIIPPIPAGVTLQFEPSTKSTVTRLTLRAPTARSLGGQNPRILELAVLERRGGQEISVSGFSDITPLHREVVRYRPDPSHRPVYSITVEVDDWAKNGGGKLGTERRTYVFGLQKDYTPNRDALAAAVNARR